MTTIKTYPMKLGVVHTQAMGREKGAFTVSQTVRPAPAQAQDPIYEEKRLQEKRRE